MGRPGDTSSYDKIGFSVCANKCALCKARVGSYSLSTISIPGSAARDRACEQLTRIHPLTDCTCFSPVCHLCKGRNSQNSQQCPTLSVCPFLAQICKDIRYECFEVRFLVTLTLPSSCAKLICCFAPLNLRCPWICSNLALIACLTSLDLSRPRLGHRYDHIDITET